jgi:stage II sporulation protein E
LKKNSVDIRDFSMIRTWEEPLEIYMYARARNGVCMTTKELANLVSKQVGVRLRVSKSTHLVLGKDYERVTLCEDTAFRLLFGVARCKKSDQEISGDSFSCMNLENGTSLLSISDGMGSGNEAYKESKMLMNLLEELIEAGFCEETAIRLIHSVLMEHPEQQSFSTLDVSVVNLYTGLLRMVKIGGAATFIKHGNVVETIQSQTLPMGVTEQADISAVERKLTDGDLIIMMSDGVLEGLQDRLPFEADVPEQMAQIIAAQGNTNLKEMASALLKKAGGKEHARDDKTVLVAGMNARRGT